MAFGRILVFFASLAVIFTVFLLLSNRAKAADDGEYVHFRIESELDVLIADQGTLTIRWYCDGATTFGEVNDDTASESTQDADGIVIVASNSSEMTDASCTIGESETLRASASIDGWVTREWTQASFPGASTSAVFTTRASLDYTIVVSGVDDELGTAITLDGTSASVSYTGTVASQSYSGLKKYIAGSTSGGNVVAEADGYVKVTSTGTMTVSGTASQSIDFGTGDDSDVDESGLAFAHKINLGGAYNSGSTQTNITGATVTAGDDGGTTCTDNSDGDYYCAVPLAETGVAATASSIPFGGLTQTLTCTYTDRDDETDAQTTCNIVATEASSAGGGGGGGTTATPTPTPTLTPTPGTTVSPTPTPSTTPGATASPTPLAGPVKLYRKVADPKVYVQGADGLLTWVRTLEDFNNAGYSWANVQVISGSEFAKLPLASGETVPAQLFRKANDPKVYVQGSDGTLTWVKTLEAFNAAGYNWADVKVISGEEFGKMMVGGQIKVVGNIAFLRVRGGPSTSNAILGTVKPGQVLQFYEWKNNWYKVKRDDGTFGWVSGGYANEI